MGFLAELTKASTKREGGEDFPPSAFAYVPDPEAPSTWKLRLWDSLDAKETAAQVGRAVAALGPGGFRGNRVQIPSEDLPRVKARVLAAWRKTHPEAAVTDAPSVLKNGEGEEAADPLDELLDAYQGFVRAAQADLADATMAIVHDLQRLMLGQETPTAKDYGSEHSDPVGCLANALLALISFPDAGEIRAKLVALIDDASKRYYAMPAAETESETETETESGGDTYAVEEGAGVYGGRMRERNRVYRSVREDGDHFVVESTTGRTFGRYSRRDQADARLAQLDTFANHRLATASRDDLVAWHDSAHSLPTITKAAKDVHDLIEDELVGGFGLAHPFTLSADDKLSMVASLAPGYVAKAAEYRYTLGPAYVPNRVDAHNEWADDSTLQKAMWDWVRKGDRTIYLQHSDQPAGEMVEMLTWPFPIDAELTIPNQGVKKFTFPSNTPFLGVVWEPWAFDLVKSGLLRGYSIGGSAKRIEADLPAA